MFKKVEGQTVECCFYLPGSGLRLSPASGTETVLFMAAGVCDAADRGDCRDPLLHLPVRSNGSCFASA